MQNLKLPILIFLNLSFLIGIYLFSGPIVQDQNYHHFIDTRSFLGINNFMDVMSNLGFVIIGLLGIKATRSYPDYQLAWKVFYGGVLLIAPGSAYYHLIPNDFTLVWDRLPMTIGFMGITIALLAEAIDLKKYQALLWTSLVIGLYSVIHWQIFNDLRLYYWVQFTPMLTIVYLALFFKAKSIKAIPLILCFALYVLAKYTEKMDHQIYDIMAGYISGHTLKHILAAIAIYFLYRMKKITKAY
jgi:hypothetical protein